MDKIYEKSGVYSISNIYTKDCYVGLAKNLTQRKNKHFYLLRKNIHHVKRLQKAFNESGQTAFEFKIIVNNIPYDELASCEKYWINFLQPIYNIRDKVSKNKKRRNTFEDIFSKVSITKTCWLWTGRIDYSGYGQTSFNGKHTSTHRFMYEYFKGLIPKGLVIDHLCKIRKCCNPEHLEAVTQQENNKRSLSASTLNAMKTHCPQGHEYNQNNIYFKFKNNLPKRICKLCKNDRSNNAKQKTYEKQQLKTPPINNKLRTKYISWRIDAQQFQIKIGTNHYGYSRTLSEAIEKRDKIIANLFQTSST